jgi:hypothetical protein
MSVTMKAGTSTSVFYGKLAAEKVRGTDVSLLVNGIESETPSLLQDKESDIADDGNGSAEVICYAS